MYSSIWGNEKSPRIKNSKRNPEWTQCKEKYKRGDWNRKEVEEKDSLLMNERIKCRCPRENRLKWNFNKGHWRKVGKQPKN